jgi:arginyl-tRNA synthetase
LKFDPSLLIDIHETRILYLLNLFLTITKNSIDNFKPNVLCQYLFILSKNLTKYYENVSIKDTVDLNLKYNRLLFLVAISEIIKKSLFLLGIDTLERM